MAEPARQRFTFDEYVRLEEMSTVKHEYLDGQVWAMAGGTPDHAAIAMNIGALLSAQLRDKPCRVYSSDLRVRVQKTGLGTYPDVTVVCDQVELDPDDPKRHTVLNPRVVVEVLSDSTERYDRGEKLEHYQQIPSLREIVLVAQSERRLDVYRREANGWLSIAQTEGSVKLESLGCELSIDETYRDPLSTAP